MKTMSYYSDHIFMNNRSKREPSATLYDINTPYKSQSHTALIHSPNYHAILQSPSNLMVPSPLPPGYELNAACIFRLGERVVVDGGKHNGILKFYGPVKFQNGLWAGVELDAPTGKNNGSVDGVHYFHCKEKHGIFVSAHRITHSFSSPLMREQADMSFRDASHIDHDSSGSISLATPSKSTRPSQLMKSFVESTLHQIESSPRILSDDSLSLVDLQNNDAMDLSMSAIELSKLKETPLQVKNTATFQDPLYSSVGGKKEEKVVKYINKRYLKANERLIKPSFTNSEMSSEVDGAGLREYFSIDPNLKSLSKANLSTANISMAVEGNKTSGMSSEVKKLQQLLNEKEAFISSLQQTNRLSSSYLPQEIKPENDDSPLLLPTDQEYEINLKSSKNLIASPLSDREQLYSHLNLTDHRPEESMKLSLEAEEKKRLEDQLFQLYECYHNLEKEKAFIESDFLALKQLWDQKEANLFIDIEDLKKKALAAENQASESTENLTMAQLQLKLNEQMIADLRSQLDHVDDLKDQMKHYAHEKEDLRVALENKTKEIEAFMSESKARFAEDEKHAIFVQYELDEKSNQLKDLQRIVKEHPSFIANEKRELEERLTEVQKEHQWNLSLLDEKSKAINVLQNEKVLIESKLSDLASRLEAAIISNTENIDGLKKSLNLKDEELALLRSTLCTKSDQFDDLTSQYRLLSKEYELHLNYHHDNSNPMTAQSSPPQNELAEVSKSVIGYLKATVKQQLSAWWKLMAGTCERLDAVEDLGFEIKQLEDNIKKKTAELREVYSGYF